MAGNSKSCCSRRLQNAGAQRRASSQHPPPDHNGSFPGAAGDPFAPPCRIHLPGPHQRGEAAERVGGYLGSPLSWDRSTEGEEGSGRFLRQDGRCSAVASPRHTTPHVSPGGSPALPSHTKLLPRGSPRAFSPLCLCSGAHPTRWKRNPCIYTSIHKSFLQDAEVERTRQAMRVSECPLSAVQDT